MFFIDTFHQHFSSHISSTLSIDSLFIDSFFIDSLFIDSFFIDSLFIVTSFSSTTMSNPIPVSIYDLIDQPIDRLRVKVVGIWVEELVSEQNQLVYQQVAQLSKIENHSILFCDCREPIDRFGDDEFSFIKSFNLSEQEDGLILSEYFEHFIDLRPLCIPNTKHKIYLPSWHRLDAHLDKFEELQTIQPKLRRKLIDKAWEHECQIVVLILPESYNRLMHKVLYNILDELVFYHDNMTQGSDLAAIPRPNPGVGRRGPTLVTAGVTDHSVKPLLWYDNRWQKSVDFEPYDIFKHPSDRLWDDQQWYYFVSPKEFQTIMLSQKGGINCKVDLPRWIFRNQMLQIDMSWIQFLMSESHKPIELPTRFHSCFSSPEWVVYILAYEGFRSSEIDFEGLACDDPDRLDDLTYKLHSPCLIGTFCRNHKIWLETKLHQFNSLDSTLSHANKNFPLDVVKDIFQAVYGINHRLTHKLIETQKRLAQKKRKYCPSSLSQLGLIVPANLL